MIPIWGNIITLLTYFSCVSIILICLDIYASFSRKEKDVQEFKSLSTLPHTHRNECSFVVQNLAAIPMD